MPARHVLRPQYAPFVCRRLPRPRRPSAATCFAGCACCSTSRLAIARGAGAPSATRRCTPRTCVPSRLTKSRTIPRAPRSPCTSCGACGCVCSAVLQPTADARTRVRADELLSKRSAHAPFPSFLCGWALIGGGQTPSGSVEVVPAALLTTATGAELDVARFQKIVHATTEQLRAIARMDALALVDQFREAVETGDLASLPHVRDAMIQLQARAAANAIVDDAVTALESYVHLDVATLVPVALPSRSATANSAGAATEAFPPLQRPAPAPAAAANRPGRAAATGAEAAATRAHETTGPWRAWTDLASALPVRPSPMPSSAPAEAGAGPAVPAATAAVVAVAPSNPIPGPTDAAVAFSSSDSDVSDTDGVPSASPTNRPPSRAERHRRRALARATGAYTASASSDSEYGRAPAPAFPARPPCREDHVHGLLTWLALVGDARARKPWPVGVTNCAIAAAVR